MHPALRIEEILLNIFSYCYSSSHRRPPRRPCWYANVHLATLARTCKTFKDPALDMIWAELNDLTPLIRCLPNTSWTESEGVYSLRKPLDQKQWDIILGYAYRVRALPSLRGSFGLAAGCIATLFNPPTAVESIFPNLSVVALHEPSATISSFLQHLAPPKLTLVWLEDAQDLGTAIETFAERCPIVTDFRMSEWAHSDTISSLICRWQNLSSVQCYDIGLNVDALLHLSRSHNLRSMSFKVHDAVVDRIPIQSTTSPHSFSALYRVYFLSHSLAPIWRLLRQFHFPVVHDLSVGLHTRPTPVDLMSFSTALQETCTQHASMEHLLLRVYDLQNESPLEDVPPCSSITFDRLRPLTVFVNIKTITLDIQCGMDLNERELLCLASSWPHLEAFEVGNNYDWTPSSAITPGGFLQLLERCRSLRVLHFMFDARGYTEIPQGHPWRGLTMPKNSFIHVLNSPIEEESINALGIFFHVAPYPDFGLTTHWNNQYFRGSERRPELCDLYYDRWVEARSLARDLWKERKELRYALETRP